MEIKTKISKDIIKRRKTLFLVSYWFINEFYCHVELSDCTFYSFLNCKQ